MANFVVVIVVSFRVVGCSAHIGQVGNQTFVDVGFLDVFSFKARLASDTGTIGFIGVGLLGFLGAEYQQTRDVSGFLVLGAAGALGNEVIEHGDAEPGLRLDIAFCRLEADIVFLHFRLHHGGQRADDAEFSSRCGHGVGRFDTPGVRVGGIGSNHRDQADRIQVGRGYFKCHFAAGVGIALCFAGIAHAIDVAVHTDPGVSDQPVHNGDSNGRHCDRCCASVANRAGACASAATAAAGCKRGHGDADQAECQVGNCGFHGEAPIKR